MQDIISNVLSFNINLSEPTWDLFILGFFILGVALYGFALGKSRLVVNMMAIYVAMAIARGLQTIPEVTSQLEIGQLFTLQLTVFTVAFLGCYYLFSRKSPLGRVANTSRKENIIHILVYSIGHVGLILVTVLSFIPQASNAEFSPLTQTIFMSPIAQYIWLLIPIILMIVYPENIKRRSYEE